MSADATWRNWSRQESCSPVRVARPRDEAELAAAVRSAAGDGLVVRAVGRGHSFTDICVTDGCLVDLSAMDRLLALDPATGVARVQPGITIGALARALHEHGRALHNQGDIDTQSLAGALATGTHGTGARFPSLSAAMVGGRLIGPDGAVLEISGGIGDVGAGDAGEAADDLLSAARVSIGALGIFSEISLRTVPAYRLHRFETPRVLSAALDELDDLVAAHDHMEIFAVPYSRRCLVLTSERTDEPARPIGPAKQWIADELLANRALDLILRAGRRVPATTPALGRLIGALMSGSERLDDSHRVFAYERRVRFTESEWAVPRAAAREALEATLALVEREGIRTSFPIEFRFGPAETALLATAHGRDSAYLSVHQYVGMEYRPYFAAVQELMRSLDGRPHWGKRHALDADALAARVPGWERFVAVRDRLDPDGVFANGYVERVLGTPARSRA